VSFENPTIVDQFIDYWRRTGNQRSGYLLGRYERYDDVPLGIRAVVVAVYEPPQVCARTVAYFLTTAGIHSDIIASFE
jgi:nuclear protein localization family protein 4